MNIKFQRSVDRLIGVTICFLLSLIDRIFGKPAAIRTPNSILVILLSQMGSLVLAQPMSARLKRKYPTALIHVLLSPRIVKYSTCLASLRPRTC